jgi:hypothetical protein
MTEKQSAHSASEEIVETVARALYEAWAEEAGLHETWEACVTRGHSIVASCRKSASVAIATYLNGTK